MIEDGKWPDKISNTAADFDFKITNPTKRFSQFWNSRCCKVYLLEFFVLTSFQILCTKLVHVEPSFVFPNYFADFQRVINKWMLCSIEDVSVLFNCRRCFCQQLSIRQGSFRCFNLFTEHFKIALMLNCLNFRNFCLHAYNLF